MGEGEGVSYRVIGLWFVSGSGRVRVRVGIVLGLVGGYGYFYGYGFVGSSNTGFTYPPSPLLLGRSFGGRQELFRCLQVADKLTTAQEERSSDEGAGESGVSPLRQFENMRRASMTSAIPKFSPAEVCVCALVLATCPCHLPLSLVTCPNPNPHKP